MGVVREAPDRLSYVQEWQKRSDIELALTIDRECAGWQCDAGLAPTVLERLAPSPEN